MGFEGDAGFHSGIVAAVARFPEVNNAAGLSSRGNGLTDSGFRSNDKFARLADSCNDFGMPQALSFSTSVKVLRC